MYHSIPQSNACEESPLKVRERCVSRIAEKKLGLRATSSQKVKRAATARGSRKPGRRPRENLAEAPQ
eukprot:689459-Pleurochrysis_carterae.AAC.1